MSGSAVCQLAIPVAFCACLLQVLQEIQERAHGITGVPNFTINGQYVLSGAQVGSGCSLPAPWPLLLSGTPSSSLVQIDMANLAAGARHFCDSL